MATTTKIPLKGALDNVALLMAILKSSGLADRFNLGGKITFLPQEYNNPAYTPMGCVNVTTICDKVALFETPNYLVIVNCELKSHRDKEVILQVRDQESAIIKHWCRIHKTSYGLDKDGKIKEIVRALDVSKDKLPILVNLVIYTGEKRWYNPKEMKYTSWIPSHPGEPTYMIPTFTFFDWPRLTIEQLKLGGPLVKAFHDLLNARDSKVSLKAAILNNADVFKNIDVSLVLAIAAEMKNEEFKNFIDEKLKEIKGKDHLNMWKAMREWEDSIRKQYDNTQKRLNVQLDSANRNIQIEQNKRKRAEQRASAETQRANTETQRANTAEQKLAESVKENTKTKMELEESKKENARILNSQQETVIFNSIKVATSFNHERSEIIKMLMDIHDLTRFEAEAYLNDYCNKESASFEGKFAFG